MKGWQTVQLIMLVLSICVLATACRSPQATQCQQVLGEIEQNSNQLQVGVLNRASHVENADLTEELANKLQSFKLTDTTLKSHVDRLAEGYRAQVAAQYEEIQLMNEAGTIQYSPGDATEATLNAIQARAKQAGEQSQLALDTMTAYCSY